MSSLTAVCRRLGNWQGSSGLRNSQLGEDLGYAIGANSAALRIRELVGVSGVVSVYSFHLSCSKNLTSLILYTKKPVSFRFNVR